MYFGRNRILDSDVAVKFYYWGSNKLFHAEPNSLAAIDSPNVLAVLNAGLIDGDWAFFVTPYCSHGDIDDVLDKTEFGNFKAIKLTCDLLIGLGALHEHRYVHRYVQRDIKPANILLSDDSNALIGDFGSIKHIPEGQHTIPASSHAVLYRPPESITSEHYGTAGDIYQAGIFFYQILGGHLPYDAVSWLTKPERKQYEALPTPPDKIQYADLCIRTRISKGKLLDVGSLPPWVNETLKRTIRKATNVDPDKRFKSAAEFQVHLNNSRSKVSDWSIEEGFPTKKGETSFRICEEDGEYFVSKRRNSNKWRKDNSIKASSYEDAVSSIEALN